MMTICSQCKKEFNTLPCYIRLGRAKNCSIKCSALARIGRPATKGRTGMPHSEETKAKMRANSPHFWKGKRMIHMEGKNNPSWRGGISKERDKVRRLKEYKIWRESVFKRDNFTCVFCGIKNKKNLGKTVYLEADHIKPFSLFPELRFVIDNGRTLCRFCHRQTETFGGRIKKYQRNSN